MNAITPARGQHAWPRAVSGVLMLTVLAAGGFTLWYRAVYNVWPGQGASGRVHWCGRDYESFGGPPQTWRQISAQEPSPIHAVGVYPPLGWSRQQLFAAATAQSERRAVRQSLVCAMIVYLRAGPGEYRAYSLEGGP